ncbi:MAG: TauD/TfdA family dioxygenase [Candidatus Latescibacteria bacterium]|nr:TauD/TfdA family dioxygenase [Candidatus Latescibacterota bacterium]
MDIRPTNACLGAVVHDLDVRDLSAGAFAELEEAWHHYGVLVMPGQDLDDEAHIAFSRRFGQLEKLQTAAVEGARPEIFAASNVGPDGRIDPVGSSRYLNNKGNRIWHTDSSFKSNPAKASLLRAVAVSGTGGETEFADMRAAYEALDEEQKEWLADKRAVHSFRYSQGQVGGLDMLSDEELDAIPPVEHPVVSTHPHSGRKSLFIGRHASHIVGEDIETSRALLETLCTQACQGDRVFRHQWRVCDLVIWDNRCVLHRGLSYPADEPRIMCRTTVAGDQADNKWALGQV